MFSDSVSIRVNAVIATKPGATSASTSASHPGSPKLAQMGRTTGCGVVPLRERPYVDQPSSTGRRATA